jgi:thymidylate synthase ThyX
MDHVAAFHSLVRNVNPVAAEYWFALGHKVQYTYTCDFRQLVYLCELRSQPAGHYSYRRIAQSLFRQLADSVFAEHKHLERMFFVDMDAPESGSRADAENRTAAKLAKLKEE